MALQRGYNVFSRHKRLRDYARLATIPVLVSTVYEGIAVVPRALNLGSGAELQVWSVGCLLIFGLGGVTGWWMAIRWRGAALDDFLAGAVVGFGSGLVSTLAASVLAWWMGNSLTPADVLLDLVARPLFTALWAGIGALAVALVSKFIEVW